MSQGRVRDDAGFQSLEFVVLFPVVLVLAGFAVFAQRTATANSEVRVAARHAARAASIAGAGERTERARDFATRSLTIGRHCVGTPDVFVSSRLTGPVEMVEVTVRCRASTLFGQRTIVGAAAEPVDVLR